MKKLRGDITINRHSTTRSMDTIIRGRMNKYDMIKVPEGHDRCCWLCSETTTVKEISLFWECRLTHHANIFEGDNAYKNCWKYLRTHSCKYNMER